MTPLCELAKKYETDKGGEHLRYSGADSESGSCHNYTPYYDAMFKGRRDQVELVLEIGAYRGCSLKMWEDYFPNAQIIGLDHAADCMKGGSSSFLTSADTRIHTFLADQNNPVSLRAAVRDMKFDIIIDDGSHERPHQLVSLYVLLSSLKPGGLYVVEDLGFHFAERELSDPATALGWSCGVIPIFGGVGQSAGIESLFWVERPL